MESKRKIAVILHGPPAIGKTMTKNEIFRQLPEGEVAYVNLDNGWGGDDDPCNRLGPYGYSDILAAMERVLVLELAHGEPADPGAKGATRGAQRWVNVLRVTGRDLFPYLLWRHQPDAVAQLLHRHNGESLGFYHQLSFYDRYASKDSQVAFPPIEDFKEQTVIMSGRTCTEVASEIIRMSGL